MGKLKLCQIIKSVGLILAGCHRIANCKPSVLKLTDPCIMSGGNIVCTDLHAPFQQCFPFHIAVTGNAGVGGSPGKIFLHKIIHHILFKFLFKIHHVIRDVQDLRYPPCVFNRRKSAAASVFLRCRFILVLPDLHGDTDDFIALFL